MSAFSGCESLTEITIPAKIEEIDKGTFNFCDNLKTVNIGEGVEIINETAFSHCDSLERITIPENVPEIHDGAVYYELQGVNYFKAKYNSYITNAPQRRYRRFGAFVVRNIAIRVLNVRIYFIRMLSHVILIKKLLYHSPKRYLFALI